MKKLYPILFILIVWVNFLFSGKFPTRWDDDSYWENIIVGEILIEYDETIDVHKASIKELRLEGKNATLVEKFIPPLNIIKVKIPGGLEETKEFIKLMEKEPGIRYVGPNRWVQLHFTPNDPLFRQYQWDKRDMNCPKAWDITLGDTTISIAIIDQGVQYDHEDLVDRFGRYKGYDFYRDDADPKPESEAEFHGTHCAGTAAATINNNKGIAGVGNVRLYAYRCGPAGPWADLGACIKAIQAAANRKIKIISMSWGTYQNIPPLQTAVRNAWNAGCLMFAASGNDGTLATQYPAAYPQVIAVGSIGPNNLRSSFSTYGPHLELVAPGENIMAPVPFNKYQPQEGTSMSCPNAAGAAALIWSVNPSLTNAQIRAILCSTAIDLGPPGHDQYYGYGKIDVYAAIQRVTPEVPNVYIEATQINEPDDGTWNPGETITIVITLKNIGKTATNVRGVLSTTNPFVSIPNNTSNYGTIYQGGTANNSINPYRATASSSATEGNVDFNLRITGDDGYSKDLTFTVPIGAQTFARVDVSAGNAILTVTPNAAIGFSDANRTKGKGFIYPRRGINTLYYGSMAFGNSSTYLVDNWFISAKQDEDWKKVSGIRWLSPPPRGDTMCEAIYNDSGMATPKGIVCRQSVWGFKSSNWDDFVILQFTYTNKGRAVINGLYSAVFIDFDIGQANQNNAGIKESKYLAWVCGSGVYAGITLIHPITLVKNVSTIKNQDYIYPDTGMTDENQFKFMNRTLHFGNQLLPNDYSIVVSAGPFNLSPGESQTVAFAVVGGTSQSSIERNADSARKVYKEYGVEEVASPPVWKFKTNPNPATNKVFINLSIPKTTNVTLNVYDISGRKVCNIINKKIEKGNHSLVWNIDDEKVPSGIYYLKLKTDTYNYTEKVILIR